MTDSKKAVEMLGGNLASFLELCKKLLVEWNLDAKKLIHTLDQSRKDELLGLMDGTHDISPKKTKTVVSGELFTPSTIVVSTTPSGKTYHLGRDHKELIGTKDEGGLFDYVDSRIESLFGYVTFMDNEVVSGRVQLFNEKLTHGNIVAEGKCLAIYREYDIVQALLLANELVKDITWQGKRVNQVFIYLKNMKNNIHYSLLVFIDACGRRGAHIHKVYLRSEGKLSIAHGALFN